MMKYKILVVDDNEDICFVLKSYFEETGYSVQVAENAFEAFSLLEKEEYDMVILDYNLGYGPTGLDIFYKIKEMNLPVKILMSTSEMDDKSLNMAIERENIRVLYKPFRMNSLCREVNNILETERDRNFTEEFCCVI
mgnify:CR=1 FL=1